MTEHPQIGDNSFSDDLLLKTVEDIERLNIKRKAVGEEIKEVLATAEAQGLDKAVIREMIKLRSLDREVLEEREATRELYALSLGLGGDK